MKPLRIIELFGGIGAFTKALEKLNIPHEVVDYVEIDKYAVKSFNAIHGTNFEPKDIKEYNPRVYNYSPIDIIVHGSPCQDFSIVGNRLGASEGGHTRSSLMYETLRIVKEIRPKVVIWENVKSVLSKKNINNFNRYEYNLRLMGYYTYHDVLNAKDYGIPQTRERLYCISIRADVNSYGNHVTNYIFPRKQLLKYTVQDILEKNVNEKYYLSDKMKKYISQVGSENYHNNNCKINLQVARPLTTEHGKRAGTTNYFSEDLILEKDIRGMDLSNIRIRRLTPSECFILMGFTYTDYVLCKTAGLSDTQLYKQTGNSIVVNVLEEIIKELLKII